MLIKHMHINKDELLKRLSILDFMLIDLGLYLNVNPNDQKALSVHATVARDADKMRQAYEAEFGPLCNRNENIAGHQWDWISDPWPWEAEANFEI